MHKDILEKLVPEEAADELCRRMVKFRQARKLSRAQAVAEINALIPPAAEKTPINEEHVRSWERARVSPYYLPEIIKTYHLSKGQAQDLLYAVLPQLDATIMKNIEKNTPAVIGGIFFKALRELAGYSQDDVEKKYKLGRYTVSNWEQGKCTIPKRSPKFEALCRDFQEHSPLISNAVVDVGLGYIDVSNSFISPRHNAEHKPNFIQHIMHTRKPHGTDSMQPINATLPAQLR